MGPQSDGLGAGAFEGRDVILQCGDFYDSRCGTVRDKSFVRTLVIGWPM